MRKVAWIALAALAASVPALPAAQGDGLAGTWKLVIYMRGQHPAFLLIDLHADNGRLVGKTLACLDPQVGTMAVTVASAAPDDIKLEMKVPQGPVLNFEGKLEDHRIVGSFDLGSRLVPAELVRTNLKSLDDTYQMAKETLATQSNGPDVIEAAMVLLSQAGAKNAKPEEVRSWADKAYRNAEAFGARYRRDIALNIARDLTPNVNTASIAVDYARRAERMLTAKDTPVTQKTTLQVLAGALRSAGKEQEANEVDAREEKIEWVKIRRYPGRKDKSDRAVLVELFTGAECQPCVAADVAFDALSKTYKPTEVVLLEYHLHVPGPDPLANAATDARSRYYGEAVQGTPTILFNGKLPEEGGGGPLSAGQKRYQEYADVIDPLLEKPAAASVKATAMRKGDTLEIAAQAEAKDPARKVRLRVALVEEQVRYTGGNRLPVYHHVVRAFPGGEEGVLLKDGSAKQNVTVDIQKLRQDLTKYLDDFAKENPFPRKERPLDLKNLRVVAFVQDDTTKEVLQATTADIAAEGS